MITAAAIRLISWKSYELTREQINANEDLKLKVMAEKHKQDIEAIRQEMNLQFSQIMFIIQENYKLAHIATALRAEETNNCCTCIGNNIAYQHG